MTCDYCQLCGHADIWHIMSGACFCQYIEDCSGEDCKMVNKQCWCDYFTTDWKKAEEHYKELKESGKLK